MKNASDNQDTPKTTEPATYPNLPQSWGLFGIFIGASVVLGGIFAAIGLLTDGISSGGTTNPWFTFIAFLGSFAITFLLAHSYAKGSRLSFSISRKQAPFWVYLLLLPLTPAMAILVDSVTSLIPMPELIEKLLSEMVSLNLPSFLTAVIAAAILEEVLCRGIILEGLLKHKTPHSAILWSAFIFATLHLNPWQGLAAFTIGCVSGWIYWRTRSLGPSIFIHFVNNGMAFGMLYLLEDPTISASEVFGDYYFLVLAGSLLVALLCGYALYSLLKDYTVQSAECRVQNSKR